ncbi:MAG: hypothetical protein IJ401_05760, partial [Oscillospiraceae bacterium]|nr:hypothetical protein [Oscillospiraceae bacterium]
EILLFFVACQSIKSLVKLFKACGFQRQRLWSPVATGEIPYSTKRFLGRGVSHFVSYGSKFSSLTMLAICFTNRKFLRSGNLFQVKKVSSWVIEQNLSQKGAGSTFLTEQKSIKHI